MNESTLTAWRGRRITVIGLAALFLVALGARLAATVILGAAHPDRRPVAYEHGEIAKNLLAGRGFSVRFLGGEGPTSQQAPFYPFALAAAYSLFGTEGFAAHRAMQILQCFIGALTPVLLAWLCWSLLPATGTGTPHGRMIGWLAGWGAALHPAQIYMVTHLQVVVWATTFLTLVIAVAADPRWRATRRGATLTGFLGGCLLLIDPILALALPVAALLHWLPSGGRDREDQSHGDRGDPRHGDGIWFPRSLLRPALVALMAIITVSPWLVRNCLVHGEFVFIKDTLGYAFWQGNNPASWGTDKIPKDSAAAALRDHDGTLAGFNRAMWEARHETLYIDDVLLKPNGYREFEGLTEPQRSRLLGARGMRFVRENPGRYAGLCLQRLRYFLLFDETNPKTASKIYRATTVIWLTLIAIGALMIGSDWRRLWPTAAIFAAVTLFHVLTITSVRFRFPIEPLTYPWAAFALAPLLTGSGKQTPVAEKSSSSQTDAASSSSRPLRGPHRKNQRAPVARRARRL
ncbi:MAG: hypothetical protein N2C14_12830 [Planctomycetales bacterium]